MNPVATVRTTLTRLCERTSRSRLGRWAAGRRDQSADVYERVYEQHARSHDDAHAVGAGEYDEFGRLELAILREIGLEPDGQLYDMGCGTGRLAVHVVPFLVSGSYIGSDISPTMLSRCRRNLESHGADMDRVELVRQPAASFLVPDGSVRMFCASSVFTHMELEDTYNYLVDARRAIAPGGSFVLSCLPVESSFARAVFLGSASKPIDQRLDEMRNVVTSTALIETIAAWAGWSVRTWYDADDASFDVPGMGSMRLGQSVLVLDPA